MNNKISKQISKYWIGLNKEKLHMCPSISLFRILSQHNIKLSKQNVLDIGFGEGQNLIECKKRGAKIFGIELRKRKIDDLNKNYKIPKKNLFKCDLNENFPYINKKFRIIFSLDTINYITFENQVKFFNNIYNHLSKGGFFLFQYPQAQLKQIKKKNFLDFWIDKKKYLVRKKFYPRKNPVVFLPNKQIDNLIKLNKKKFNLLSSTFDIGTFSKPDSSSITINRFLLLKKK
jgi:SAM-dependent methyltransferase